MRATGNRASLKVAQAFSQRNRWKKYLICQQQNKGIQLHIPDNLTFAPSTQSRGRFHSRLEFGAIPGTSYLATFHSVPLG
jgi:hypothetical protein